MHYIHSSATIEMIKIKLILLLLITVNLTYAQSNFSIINKYSAIDSVNLQIGNELIITEILTSHIYSLNKTWNKIASQLCVWQLQQEKQIPLIGPTPILNMIYISSDTGYYSTQNYMLSTPNLSNYALIPDYKELSEYIINNLKPLDLTNFETALINTRISTKSEIETGFFQEFLLKIALINPSKPNKDIDNSIKKLRQYYQKEQQEWSTKIFDYLESKIQKQLDSEWVEVDDE